MNIQENIFREYDIRGVYGIELTDELALYIGKAYGSIAREKEEPKIVVGYDNRVSSPALHDKFVEGVLSTGTNVVSIGLCTTPMIYFAREFVSHMGVMITASHNPSEDNGFKFSINNKNNCVGKQIQDFLEYIKRNDFKTGEGKLDRFDIMPKYIEMLESKIKLGDKKLKVVLDCGNGTGSIVAPEVLRAIGVDLVELYCESDPAFPNHHPDPSVEKNMQDLKNKVLELGADVGIGLDGDADRIGVVDEKGNIIHTDEYMIIIWRDIINKVKSKRAVFDVKCSKSLEDEIIKLGGTPEFYRTGNSYMKAKIMNEDLDFVGEYSGHVFFKDEFYGFDDGLYAALRLIRILSNTDKTVSELLAGVNKYYSTEELKIKTTDENKSKIVARVKDYASDKGYKMLTIDGVRVMFDDGWVLVRQSNTGPNVTARIEASSDERLKELQEEFMPLLEA